nr:MAG: hypothetical protein [Enquatrovirus sp.]
MNMNEFTKEQQAIINRYLGGIQNLTPEQSKKAATFAKDTIVSNLAGIGKLPADILQIFPERSMLPALGRYWENGVDYAKDALLSEQAVKDYYATKRFYEQNGIFTNPIAAGLNPAYNWLELAGGMRLASKAIPKGINTFKKNAGQAGGYYSKKIKDFLKGAARGENAAINGTALTGLGLYNDYYKDK